MFILFQFEDRDSILSLTKDDGLHPGTDYLPFVLNNWLSESSSPGSLRENYVLLSGTDVIGFTSLYFQNDRNTAVKFAVRILKELRGKGYGKKLEHLLHETLTMRYPQLGSFELVIVDEGKIRNLGSPQFGDVLTHKALLDYKFRCNQLEIPPVGKGLSELSKDEFAEDLRAGRVRHLLENNLLHMQFVPVRPRTEEDIEFAVRKRQSVMAEEISAGGAISSLRNQSVNPIFLSDYF